jgi:OFA family oxalate/formate antiporter-like MFS transporter
MCFVYGIISGVGTGLAYVTPMATVVKWFPKKKGLMGGIVVFGFGAGAFIFSPLVRFLINQFSWQAAFVSLGMIFLVVGILLSRFIQLPPSDFDQQEENASEKNVALVNWSPTHVLRSRIFWLAWSAWFLVLTVGLGLMGHIVSYASGSGIDAMSAAYVLSVIAIFNGAGRIIFGGISDYIGRVNSLIGACFVMAAVIGGLIFFGDQLIFLYSLGAVFGLCFGTCLVLYPMFASEIFGTKHLGMNYGMLFSSYGVGGFVGPILFGRLYDMSGNYQLILLISAGLCIVAGVLAIMVWKNCAHE